MVRYGDVPQVYGVAGTMNNKTVNCSSALTDPATFKHIPQYLRVTAPVETRPVANWGIADPNAVTGYMDQYQPTPYGVEGSQEEGTIEGYANTDCPQPYASGLPNLMPDGAGYQGPQEPQTTFQGLAPLTGAPIDTVGVALTAPSMAQPWPMFNGVVDVERRVPVGRGDGGREDFNDFATVNMSNLISWLVSVLVVVMLVVCILQALGVV